MLAHNEVRHETIRNMYEQAVQQASDDDVGNDLEPMEPMEHSLPQDCCECQIMCLLFALLSFLSLFFFFFFGVRVYVCVCICVCMCACVCGGGGEGVHLFDYGDGWQVCLRWCNMTT